MTEHAFDELEAYALGALTTPDAERVAAHLAECDACRREAASLAEVVGSIPDTVPLREPSALLRDRVLARARSEVAATRRPTRRWSLGTVRIAPIALAGLASAVVVLGAMDFDAMRRLSATSADRDAYESIVESIREGGRVWYMAGKDEFAGSGGTLFDPRADGKPPFVLFHDLPAIPQGKVLTVWLVSPDSTWARAATFVPDGRDVQSVRVNMEVAGFDRCAVTLEDSPWGPRRGSVVMESRIAPPPPQQ
jgi:hypothetical protein